GAARARPSVPGPGPVHRSGPSSAPLSAAYRDASTVRSHRGHRLWTEPAQRAGRCARPDLTPWSALAGRGCCAVRVAGGAALTGPARRRLVTGLPGRRLAAGLLPGRGLTAPGPLLAPGTTLAALGRGPTGRLGRGVHPHG